MMHYLQARRTGVIGTVVWLAQAGSLLAAPVIFSAAGPDAAAIQPTVSAFTTALGANNGVGPCEGCTTGFRGINWDGVPDALSTPNLFPGDFFNQPLGSPAGRIRA